MSGKLKINAPAAQRCVGRKVHRLALAVGETAPVPVAWLTFPEFQLRRLDQRYERVGQDKYHFEATELRFAVDLKVDRFGIVRDYPGLWKEEGG